MSTVSAALLGLAVGLLAGAALAWLLLRGRAPAETPAPPEQTADPVPDGVREVLGSLRSGGIVLDARGSVLWASASAVAFGLVRDHDLVHAQLRELARRVERDRLIREVELDLARGPVGQGRLIVGVRIAPVGEDLVLLLVEDRSQAQRLEETRRDFVVNVSHELKTPIGGLTLLAEAVEGAADDPEAVTRFAGRMKREAVRLSRLVTEIVDLSRLQTTVISDPELVDVAACAREAVEHTRLVAGQRRLTATETDDRSRLQVWGDPDLITTAIRNLVTNAINYSEDGTRVTVVTRRQGNLVLVAVTDEGQGIAPADQDRIFERFYRVDPARSRATGGTGLGLSIVKHICANHGGDVSVWSEPAHGSTFTVRLPAADPAGPARPLPGLASVQALPSERQQLTRGEP